jgi:hypothetical protein
MPAPFATVPEALEEFAQGRVIIVVDDEDRENEGDLTLAAEFVTPDAINVMAKSRLWELTDHASILRAGRWRFGRLRQVFQLFFGRVEGQRCALPIKFQMV